MTKKLPKVSIVIPSYNQVDYIEETFKSIFDQNYPNLEVLVIDGGSTDGSVEVIKKYAEQIDYWVSEPDKGQSDAINKGLEKATGDWLAFMNSDDGYWDGALTKIFDQDLNGIDFIYSKQGYVGNDFESAKLRVSEHIDPLSTKNLLKFFYNLNYIIPSQSVFISRALYEKVGGVREDLHYCMDMEWYVRISLEKPRYYCADFPTYFYRVGDHTKTASMQPKMYAEAKTIARSYYDRLPLSETRDLKRLIAYSDGFKELSKKEHIKVKHLLELLGKNPQAALRDRRFLGMLKRNVF